MDKPVVVGVDGSVGSLAALDWAVDEAVRRGLPLRLVHTCLWDRYESVVNVGEGLGDGREETGVTALAAERAAARAGQESLEIRTEVLSNVPAADLVRQSMSAGLLVLGCRGHGGFPGMLLGSVSLQVAAQAFCPVVVVRGSQDNRDRRGRRVVVGVSGRDVPGPAVDFAFAEAELWQARLDVVHAWRAQTGAGAPGPDIDRAQRLLASAVTGAKTRHPQVRAELLPLPGLPPHAALLEAAAGADLLVVGARHSGGASAGLGPVSHAMLHHAPCPVAVVPAG